jgi:hypothetical protein
LYLRLEIAAENAASAEISLRGNKCSRLFQGLKPRKIAGLAGTKSGLSPSLAAQTAPKAVTG